MENSLRNSWEIRMAVKEMRTSEVTFQISGLEKTCARHIHWGPRPTASVCYCHHLSSMGHIHRAKTE